MLLPVPLLRIASQTSHSQCCTRLYFKAGVIELVMQHIAGYCQLDAEVLRIEMDDPHVDVKNPPSAYSGYPEPFGYMYQGVWGERCTYT